jgi:hypothetical protein
MYVCIKTPPSTQHLYLHIYLNPSLYNILLYVLTASIFIKPILTMWHTPIKPTYALADNQEHVGVKAGGQQHHEHIRVHRCTTTGIYVVYM